MHNRISLVTLGVADVARSAAFYEAWGWTKSAASVPGTTFFQAQGLVLSLYGRAELARDMVVPDRPTGFPAFSLGYNTDAKEDVELVYRAAIEAGATALSEPHQADWGGTIAYFTDPDGHPWEIAWNPGFPMDAQGHLFLPDHLK
jgi:catechol 2,3-dioxygenase-like lactoylglutathione lyase family enzyme